jgi:hypothetical protein
MVKLLLAGGRALSAAGGRPQACVLQFATLGASRRPHAAAR